MFRQDYTCPALLKAYKLFYLYGAITLYGVPSQELPVISLMHWPSPRSLATTNGVSIDVLSSGY